VTFLTGLREILKSKLWKRASIFIRSPLGELDGSSLTAVSERKRSESMLRKRTVCPYGISAREPGGTAILVGALKNIQ
jgi:hypothetical protein